MPRRKWSREKVLAAVRSREARGLSLNCSRAKREDISLYSAACYYFGSWAPALEALGISVPRQKKWHKNDLVRILRSLTKPGGVIDCRLIEAESKRIGRDIRGATRRIFGSLGTARQQLGLAPRQPPVTWTKDKVIEEIRKLSSAGTLRHSFVKRTLPRLLSAIDRRFGSWTRGLAAAGVTAGTRWTRPEVLRVLQSAWEERDIRINSLKDRFGDGVYIAAIRHFGSWQSALTAAEVPSWAYNTRMASRRALLTRGG